MYGGITIYDVQRLAVTPCNDYLEMSWGGSEKKNRWFQLPGLIFAGKM